VMDSGLEQPITYMATAAASISVFFSWVPSRSFQFLHEGWDGICAGVGAGFSIVQTHFCLRFLYFFAFSFRLHCHLKTTSWRAGPTP
jgi:hypothetical protein